MHDTTSSLSRPALQWAALAVLRQRSAMQRELAGIDPESERAAEISDDIIQSIKVEAELYDAYTQAQQASSLASPSWQELEIAAGVRDYDVELLCELAVMLESLRRLNMDGK